MNTYHVSYKLTGDDEIHQLPIDADGIDPAANEAIRMCEELGVIFLGIRRVEPISFVTCASPRPA